MLTKQFTLHKTFMKEKTFFFEGFHNLNTILTNTFISADPPMCLLACINLPLNPNYPTKSLKVVNHTVLFDLQIPLKKDFPESKRKAKYQKIRNVEKYTVLELI